MQGSVVFDAIKILYGKINILVPNIKIINVKNSKDTTLKWQVLWHCGSVKCVFLADLEHALSS